MTGIVLALAGLTCADGGGGAGMTAPALAEVRNADPLRLIRPGMTVEQVEGLLGERGFVLGGRGFGFGFGPGVKLLGLVAYSRSGISIDTCNGRVMSVHRSERASARPR